MTSGNTSRAPTIGLLLAGGMCLLPFLLPYHQLPIKTFQAEWLVVALGVAAAFAVICNNRPGIPIPYSARWFGAFAALLLIQAALGHAAYPQLRLTGALLILYAMLMIWLGAQLSASLSLNRVAMTLAAFLLAGAIANACAGIIQYYGRPFWLEDFVAELHGSRAYGNIAQSNLYANYLALGLASPLYLWIRGGISSGGVIAGLALLNFAAALTGSRTWILYIAWFSVLCFMASRSRNAVQAQRLKKAAYGLMAFTALMQISVPWINDFLNLGRGWSGSPVSRGGLERVVSSSEFASDLRLQAWLLAWRIFLDKMAFGTGLGEFARAAFDKGLSFPMAQEGDVWTSPHNVVLQLLSETGIAGTLLVIGAWGLWWRRIYTHYSHTRNLASGWIIATVGVEAIQSLIEYPLWNAHFLGVTALLMGIGEVSATPRIQRSNTRLVATVATVASLTLAFALGLVLRDYVRLDSVLITGTAPTLINKAQKEHDETEIREVAQGILAPIAELWILRGAPLDRSSLTEMLPISERVASYLPSLQVLILRAAWLALADRDEEAEELVRRVLRTFPHRCPDAMRILRQVLEFENVKLQRLLEQVRQSSCR